MLRRIHIHNHALIHEVELDLEEGFHVFTGETGSGKSILLGAVGLLLCTCMLPLNTVEPMASLTVS